MSPPPDDALVSEQAFPALDAYLQALHAGKPPDRKQVLAEHPELAPILDCLDSLEKLVPPIVGGGQQAMGSQEAKDAAERPTIPHLGDSESDSLPTVHGPLPGDFGKYQLLQEIGRGGMGVVYKARQKDLDRVVALKMILASHLASGEQVTRFHAEARAAARLQHPHVVSIYEAGQIHGQHYFAMPFVAGPSLAGLVKKGPLDPEAAARHVCSVARTVDHLHKHGVVHRDLKPSNILLDENDQPYVTDFGLVKMLGSDSHVTTTGVIVGTPSYMAPEQASGKTSEVGPLSDVYSLGAILYELLTGKPPFEEETALDTLVQVLESEPARPRQVNPNVPEELELICLRCLEKTPEERYPSAAALADDLDRFLRGEDVEARQPGLWQRLHRWSRREPALASHLGGLALCTAIVQTNFHISTTVELGLHLQVLAVFAVWALASVLFQGMLRKERWSNFARLAWAGADVVLLTVALKITEFLASPLVAGYAVLIVASGLWFRTRLIWFTTAIAITGYGMLVVDSYVHGTGSDAPHTHVIFMACLAVLGFILSYQVQRVRVLSRYYEHRPLP